MKHSKKFTIVKELKAESLIDAIKNEKKASIISVYEKDKSEQNTDQLSSAIGFGIDSERDYWED